MRGFQILTLPILGRGGLLKAMFLWGGASAGDMSIAVGERFIVHPAKSQFGWYLTFFVFAGTWEL